MQIDPLAFEYVFFSPYAYAGDDPINYIDKDGLSIEPAAVTSLVSSLKAAGAQNVVARVVGGTGRWAGKWMVSGVLANGKGFAKVFKSAGFFTKAIGRGAEIGLKGVVLGSNIVMSNRRYNHHSGNYLPNSTSGGISGKNSSSSSKGRGGMVMTSEFGGGNNAPKGQTDEPSENLDLLTAVISSWMGGDVEFAKKWEEIIEKLPSRLKEGIESVETYKELKEKKELEEYVKRAYEELTTPKNSTQNAQSNKPITPQPQETAPRKFVFIRLNRYGNEPAGSVQDHAYITDSTEKLSPGKNPGKPVDTFFIRNKNHPVKL
jgi:hypothetical protein